MIKNFFFIGFTFLMSSCLKFKQDCGVAGTSVAPPNEKQRVLNFLNMNPDPGAVQLDTSGMYYSISVPGNTKKPSLCSVVDVKYQGRLENGNVFDKSSVAIAISFPLGRLIEGWKRALPLIGEGGKMKLYIPPELGYGPEGSIDPQTGEFIIPPNEIIIFDVELVSFR